MVNLSNSELKTMDLVAISEWDKYFNFCKASSIRQLIFYNKNNFVEKVVRRINGRMYIRISAFNDYIEETSKKDGGRV